MTPLDRVIDTFREWLHLPDFGALLAMLAAVAANRLLGDPVWLLLIGPPGGGKSELLGALSGLPDVHPAATLTEASLLSGTPKRESGEGAHGGLLRVIGNHGLIVCKDFGSVLSMNRDARAALLAALREIYDGSWTRHVGTDGGRTLAWQGKVGLIGGCTPSIDRHHTVMGAMGERFVLYRLPPVDGTELSHRALAHAGHEREMRRALSTAVNNLFMEPAGSARPLDAADRSRLVALAEFAVRARSAIERDSYTREVELIPEPEAPTRLVVVLATLLDGLDIVGADREQAWAVVTKAALDSMPALRRATLDHLHASAAGLDTTQAAVASGYPTTTARRALEELTAHGLVTRTQQGAGHADHWTLSEWARAKLDSIHASVPEKSESPITHPHRVYDDISGTPPVAEELSWR